MTTQNSDDGATQVPDNGSAAECMGKWRHKFSWVWEKGQMTDKCQCINCGEIITVKMPDPKPAVVNPNHLYTYESK